MIYETDHSLDITAKRENLEIYPGEWRYHVWVARDENDEVLDWSAYRNDLLCKFPNMMIIGEQILYAVFLDIDGVFTSTRVHYANAVKDSVMWDVFDPVAVAFMNKIASEHNVHFVLTSTWINGLKTDDPTIAHWITTTFRNAGFRGTFPYPNWKVNPQNEAETYIRNRAHWIKEYLEEYRYTDFIIFDDTDYKFNEVLGVKRFIQTHPQDGLLTKQMLNAASIIGAWT